MPESKPKMLVLNLHRKWFALVASGEKQIEYRRWTAFWERRIPQRAPFTVRFLNGMLPPVPEVTVTATRVVRDSAKKEIRIYLGKILSVRNWPPK
ncbi:MAG: ASCH domain-containing protein [Polyangiaceae bacterium]|nr:ASCH domain-containing protein [Polyangiaceae bacterium]